jgi:hypothetical protein
VASGALEVLVEEVLATTPLTRYARVRDFAGFRKAIVSIVQEFSSAGGTVEHLAECGAEPDFIQVYTAVLAALKQRNLTLRAEQAPIRGASDRGRRVRRRYRTTARRLLLIYGAGAGRGPCSGQTNPSDGRARRMGRSAAGNRFLAGLQTSTRVLPERLPAINRVLSVAPTLDTEVAEIARRIVQAHDNGRPWREMGVLVRSEATYVPALRSAFARLNIPARFYFSSALANAAAVRYLSTVMTRCSPAGTTKRR